MSSRKHGSQRAACSQGLAGDGDHTGSVHPSAARWKRLLVGAHARLCPCRPGVSGAAFDRREDAEAVLRIVRMDVTAGRSFEEAVAPFLTTKSKRNLLAARYAEFLALKADEVKAGDLSPTTLREYQRLAREGGELEFFAERTVGDVTPALLKRWSGWLAARGLSPKSRRNLLGMLRTFYSWLREEGVVQSPPSFASATPSEVEHRPRTLTPEVQERVLAEIPEPARGAFLAMALLGVRPGEARALDVSDVEGDALMIARAVKGQAADSPIGPTKSRTVRDLAMPERLRAWVEAHAPAAGVLFRNPHTGERWSHWALWNTWKGACDAAGVPRVKLYEGTKHSMATAAKARGHDDRAIAAVLGHADLRSTARYAKLARKHLRDVVGE